MSSLVENCSSTCTNTILFTDITAFIATSFDKQDCLHEKIVGQQLEYLLMAFKDFADVVLAINYLPPGSLLWAGKLNKKEIGLIGTISSLLRLVMLFRHLKRNGETDS
ncbi:uncharacterized protein TNCV_1334761 [Trichonephila clavipes]|nr:uncharacterized protein TNCV_1334761 [Trichonephila clavipes]